MEKRELDSCLCRIADGDMEALARLYQHFYRPVYLLAVSRTSDPSLAEDIAQEVFLTIRTQAASYESGNAGPGFSALPKTSHGISCGGAVGKPPMRKRWPMRLGPQRWRKPVWTEYWSAQRWKG